MKHLYIIGNGFDQAHGLKTSYRDFVLWYLNRKLTSIYRDSSSINDGLIKIEKRPRTLLTYTLPVISDVRDFKKEVDNVIELYERNLKIHYSPLFAAILSIDGWADIEKLYFELLLDIHFKTN